MWIYLSVDGVRNAMGKVAATVYADDPDRFLVKNGSMYVVRTPAIAGVTKFCVFLPSTGVYAIAVYHDEDNSGTINRGGVLGIPTEGFGFTNNPPTLGEPAGVSHGAAGSAQGQPGNDDPSQISMSDTARPDVLVAASLPPVTMAALDLAFTTYRLSDEDALARVRGMAASTLAGPIGPAMLDRLPALEVIANFGVGYDNIDVAAAVERGIVVTNTAGVLDEEVADLTLGLLLATLRRIPAAERFCARRALGEGQFSAFAFAAWAAGRDCRAWRDRQGGCAAA